MTSSRFVLAMFAAALAGILCASLSPSATADGSLLNMLRPAGGTVEKQYQYEVSAKLTLDGVPVEIDRSGTCEYHVGIPIGAPPNVRTASDWVNAGPDAIASVRPDGSAVIVVLPSLCAGTYGETKSDPGAPLIMLLKREVKVVWIPHVNTLDSFEEYSPIDPDIHFPHADLTDITLKPLPRNTRLQTPLPSETALAIRFGTGASAGTVETSFTAQGAYVIPESYWSKDTYFVKLFQDRHEPTVFSQSCGWPKAPDEKLLHHHLIALRRPGLYEVPMVHMGDTWVLDEAHRETLTYINTQIHPDASTRVFLTYKGHIMKCGAMIYDPDGKLLVLQGFFETSK